MRRPLAFLAAGVLLGAVLASATATVAEARLEAVLDRLLAEEPRW